MSNILSEKIQSHPYTSYDRYPSLWERAAELITNPSPNVLVFGCSTGEECITALAYLPKASVIGVEQRIISLRMAILRNNHPQITYIHSSEMTGMLPNVYDLVTANSVICHHPDNAFSETNEAMTFEQFESIVTELAAFVAPGGVLLIHNAEYRFSDTAVSAGFSKGKGRIMQECTVFEKDGSKSENRSAHVIWIKN